jgi:hypothetical protein
MVNADIMATCGLFLALRAGIWCLHYFLRAFWLLSYIRRKPSTETDVGIMFPGLNTLSGLPVELVLSILDFLPADDIFCLSVCNLRLSAILHRKIETLQRPTARDKLPILRRIERDLPNHFICHCCFLLHELDGSEDFGLCGRRSQWKCRLPCIVSGDWEKEGLQIAMHEVPARVDYKLCFIHVYLAMRRFRLGVRSGISPNALNYSQRREFAGLMTLFCIQAKVCRDPPGLFVRIQDIMLLGNRNNPGKGSTIPPQFLRICAHVFRWMTSTYVQSMTAGHVIDNKVCCWKDRCEICNTHFELERRLFGGDVVLVLTRWLDLGPGLSPDDCQWKAHAVGATHVEPIAVSPRISFEAASSEGSHEASILRGVSYLKHPREGDVIE